MTRLLTFLCATVSAIGVADFMLDTVQPSSYALVVIGVVQWLLTQRQSRSAGSTSESR